MNLVCGENEVATWPRDLISWTGYLQALADSDGDCKSVYTPGLLSSTVKKLEELQRSVLDAEVQLESSISEMPNVHLLTESRMPWVWGPDCSLELLVDLYHTAHFLDIHFLFNEMAWIIYQRFMSDRTGEELGVLLAPFVEKSGHQRAKMMKKSAEVLGAQRVRELNEDEWIMLLSFLDPDTLASVCAIDSDSGYLSAIISTNRVHISELFTMRADISRLTTREAWIAWLSKIFTLLIELEETSSAHSACMLMPIYHALYTCTTDRAKLVTRADIAAIAKAQLHEAAQRHIASARAALTPDGGGAPRALALLAAAWRRLLVAAARLELVGHYVVRFDGRDLDVPWARPALRGMFRDAAAAELAALPAAGGDGAGARADSDGDVTRLLVDMGLLPEAASAAKPPAPLFGGAAGAGWPAMVTLLLPEGDGGRRAVRASRRALGRSAVLRRMMEQLPAGSPLDIRDRCCTMENFSKVRPILLGRSGRKCTCF
jgi:hypothetical protein